MKDSRLYHDVHVRIFSSFPLFVYFFDFKLIKLVIINQMQKDFEEKKCVKCGREGIQTSFERSKPPLKKSLSRRKGKKSRKNS